MPRANTSATTTKSSQNMIATSTKNSTPAARTDFLPDTKNLIAKKLTSDNDTTHRNAEDKWAKHHDHRNTNATPRANQVVEYSNQIKINTQFMLTINTLGSINQLLAQQLTRIILKPCPGNKTEDMFRSRSNPRTDLVANDDEPIFQEAMT